MLDSPVIECAVVGECGAGKTALISALTRSPFPLTYEPTTDVTSEDVELPGGRRVRLWDTPGQEHDRWKLRSLFSQCSLFLVVYDIRSPNALQDVKRWISTVAENRRSGTTTLMVVGNKADCDEDRRITSAAARCVAQHHHCLYGEVSALTGYNLFRTFHLVVDASLDKRQTTPPCRIL